jgi:hypothetical protein
MLKTKTVKKVYKYATGQPIPDGAVYLNTVVQTQHLDYDGRIMGHCWFVWHYFLVEVEKDETKT